MKTYQLTDKPIEICGLEVIDPAREAYWRLPDEESSLVSEAVQSRSKTPCGGRVCFRTDSRTLQFKMSLHTLGVDPCIAVCGSGGADVMCGTGTRASYLGLITPGNYDRLTAEASFHLDGKTRQITVNLPRNERLKGLEISIDDDAQMLPPLPFATPGKICYYGSSITEGGCAARTGNAYAAAVSRWLDSDYVNFGFSGAARGEDAMADILCKRDYSALVYDYDHNAPSAEHLAATHERFFQRVRRAHPGMPVLMLSKPDFDADRAGGPARREVILRTYQNARAAGDQNVYYLDGEQFFGILGREMCTVDGCHPTDLGSYRMAEKVYGMLLKILG